MNRTTLFFSLLFIASLALGVFLAFRRTKRGSLAAQPRQVRQQQRKALWLLVPAFVFNEYLAIRSQSLAGMLFFGVAIIVNVAMALRDPTRSEEIINWRMDKTKCGRCEYDLTGNVTGICSECGWKFPGEDAIVETKSWTAFWKQWRIDYLENWKLTLAGLLGSLAFSSLCLAYVVRLGVWPFTAFIGLLFLLGLIQVLRVIQYAMQKRSPTPGPHE